MLEGPLREFQLEFNLNNNKKNLFFLCLFSELKKLDLSMGPKTIGNLFKLNAKEKKEEKLLKK